MASAWLYLYYIAPSVLGDGHQLKLEMLVATTATNRATAQKLVAHYNKDFIIRQGTWPKILSNCDILQEYLTSMIIIRLFMVKIWHNIRIQTSPLWRN